jgi:hypothetical protein
VGADVGVRRYDEEREEGELRCYVIVWDDTVANVCDRYSRR